MRETRTYGSEGGEEQSFPTPIEAVAGMTLVQRIDPVSASTRISISRFIAVD